MSLRTIRVILLTIAAMGACLKVVAQETNAVASINKPISINDATDYVVSSIEPFGAEGEIDLTSVDARLVLQNVKPSEFISQWISHVKVNGEAAAVDENILVGPYSNYGTIVTPHAKGFTPLKVFSEADLQGESKGDYTVDVIYKSLSDMNNKIRSFTLKRGYMVTMATNSNGTGYSRCFVADNSDLSINLQPELAGKVSFLRIVPWHYVSKRGWGGGTLKECDMMNAPWWYNWSAGSQTTPNVEYVPHKHQIWWPSNTEINAKKNVTHLLGENEPDYPDANGNPAFSVSAVLNEWPNMYASGLRVGSPACCDANAWLYAFLDSCDAYNYRVDFVALHCYWYMDAKDWVKRLDDIHKKVKRPIWITEMNYGANWTGWPLGDDRSASDANQKLYKEKMTAITRALDSLDYVERYCIFNWVEDCRAMILDATPDTTVTQAGIAYANGGNLRQAYSEKQAVAPAWRYDAPEAPQVVLTPTKMSAKVSWKDNNGELTDSLVVERSLDGGDFEPIETLYYNNKTQYSITDNLPSPKNVSYRVKIYCADGKSHTSAATTLSLTSTEGTEAFQFGRLSGSCRNDNYAFFFSPFSVAPIVIFSPITYNNSSPICPTLTAPKTSYLQMGYIPWNAAKTQLTTKKESIDILAVNKGNGTIGGLNYEAEKVVRTQLDKSYFTSSTGKLSTETAYVRFNQPFKGERPPIVLLNVIADPNETFPTMWKVFDVTNEGFFVRLCREARYDAEPFSQKTVMYVAIEQGEGQLDDGRTITVSRTENAVGGLTAQTIPFGEGEHPNPLFWGEPQTAREERAAIYRNRTLTEESASIIRKVDDSVDKSSSTQREDYGWLLISGTPSHPEDAIQTVVPQQQPQSSAWYTLDGRQISAPSRKGIYISRGKLRIKN